MAQPLTFTKATKTQVRARIALVGPSGSGKTYTALKLATAMGQRVALVDTENHSASLYAGEFEFDTLALPDERTVAPKDYVEAIHAAEEAGYDVLIIDSLSHAWAGKEGALAMADQASKRYRGNTFAAWRDVTPHHNALVDALVFCKCHLIATMRTKTEYVVETGDKGKMVPKKIGLAPIQRQGIEYEFDIVGDMDLDHNLIISKTRYKDLDGKVINCPTEKLGKAIVDWLNEGEAPAAPKATPPRATTVPPAQTAGESIKELYGLDEPLSTTPPEPELAEDTAESPPNTAQAVKERLQSLAEAKGYRSGTGPSSGQLGLMNGLLTDILGADERKLFLAWTYDLPTAGFTTAGLNRGQVEAVLDALQPTRDDENSPYRISNDKAIPAFQAALVQARIDTGQLELELEPESDD